MNAFRFPMAVVASIVGAVASAQVPCGDPNVFIEAIPPVAPLGQLIEIKLTNNTMGSLGVPDGCTYETLHLTSSCLAAGAIRFNFACTGQVANVPAGASTSGYWDQMDDFGQQVPPGEYWASVFYFKGGQGFGKCCFPFTISSPLATYCTAKPNFVGCVAGVSTSDPQAQPVSGLGDYSVTAKFVEPGKTGLLFAGTTGSAALPFPGGGVLCIQPPIKRGPVMNSGGALPGCGGSLSSVVNDGTLFPAGFDPGPGNSAWYQFWFRIRGGTSFGLSNAVRLDFQ